MNGILIRRGRQSWRKVYTFGAKTSGTFFARYLPRSEVAALLLHSSLS